MKTFKKNSSKGIFVTLSKFPFAGVIVLASILLTMFPAPLQNLQRWMNKPPIQSGQTNNTSNVHGPFFGEEVPCTSVTVKTVWSRAFARLNSESPLRKADINGDHVDDIIVGYGLGRNGKCLWEIVYSTSTC